MKAVILLFLFALIELIIPTKSLKCGDYEIENCISCNSTNKNETCGKCKDKHFLFFNDLLCLPCDHPYYGQFGCGGNCDGSKYIENRMPICEEGGCKEGYYNLAGICWPCEIGSDACAKCIYEVQENNKTNDYFKCHQCKNNQFKLNEFGLCEHCLKDFEFCEMCHFNEDFTDKICDKCIYGFYTDSKGKCKKCQDVAIEHGGCIVCSDDVTDYKSGFCTCFDGYRKVGHSKCDYYHSRCTNYVYYPGEDPICIRCDSEKVLHKNKCIDCPIGCTICKYIEKYSQKLCLKCADNYALIKREQRCVDNTDKNDLYLYGCLYALYNDTLTRYVCEICKYDFVKIIEEETCRDLSEIGISKGCSEVENLRTIEDPLYFCKKCVYSYILINETTKGIQNCAERKDNLIYCLEGVKDENENYNCTKCVEHASFNDSNICECNFGFFGYFYEKCYECDNLNYGQPGCNPSKGCTYIHSNDELDCNECKEGYFEFTRGQCFLCENEISNCDKCHFDGKNETLRCDNCLDIYKLNDKEGKCEMNICTEYPDISPGCIICNDKINQYKPFNKCQTCKYGYFKTKEESCVYCKSNLYGGSFCYQCGYGKDENGEETNNIICKPSELYEENNIYFFLNCFIL